jgi:hypothetical protein
MLRSLIIATALAALSAGSAFAQSAMGIPLKQEKSVSQEEVEKQKAFDRAYEASMRKIPDKTSPADPWGDVRPTSRKLSKNKQQ